MPTQIYLKTESDVPIKVDESHQDVLAILGGASGPGGLATFTVSDDCPGAGDDAGKPITVQAGEVYCFIGGEPVAAPEIRSEEDEAAEAEAEALGGGPEPDDGPAAPEPPVGDPPPAA